MKLMPKIREKRMEAHLTQTQLAQSIGMNRSQLSLIENGKHYPLPIALWQFSRACNCKVDDLYEFVE